MNPCNGQMQLQQEQLMHQFERDRDSAASVTEKCHLCKWPGELEECDNCLKSYCPECMVEHSCTAEILYGGRQE